MKKATPDSINVPINRLISLVNKFNDVLSENLNLENKVTFEVKKKEYLFSEFKKIETKVEFLFENTLNNEKKLKEIYEEIFIPIRKIEEYSLQASEINERIKENGGNGFFALENPLSFDRTMYLSIDELHLFLNKIEKLKQILNKQKTKKEKTKGIVIGIKGSRWEDILILTDGTDLKVSEKDTFLGIYSLNEIGIPTGRNSGKNKLFSFFMTLAFSKEKMDEKFTDIISSTKNVNQATKLRFKKIFNEAFGLSADPVRINKDGLYSANFKLKFMGNLRINDHTFGGELYK